MGRPVRFLTLLLCVVAACGAVALFVDGRYLPIKPCRPLRYSDNARVSQNTTLAVSVAISSVLHYYDSALQPVEVSRVKFGQWSKEQLDGGVVLYSCTATDINYITTETGCIYLSSKGISDTEIKLDLLRATETLQACPKA